MTVQASGLVILTREGRKDLSCIERLALRHRLRRVERFTLDRSFVAFAGTAMLLPGNGGVSVGVNRAIKQGDHKDRPYPRNEGVSVGTNRAINQGDHKDRPYPRNGGGSVGTNRAIDQGDHKDRPYPGNGGVSVGTNLVIKQGDHKDRPYPRNGGVAEGCVGVSG